MLLMVLTHRGRTPYGCFDHQRARRATGRVDFDHALTCVHRLEERKKDFVRSKNGALRWERGRTPKESFNSLAFTVVRVTRTSTIVAQLRSGPNLQIGDGDSPTTPANRRNGTQKLIERWLRHTNIPRRDQSAEYIMQCFYQRRNDSTMKCTSKIFIGDVIGFLRQMFLETTTITITL